MLSTVIMIFLCLVVVSLSAIMLSFVWKLIRRILDK